MAVGSGKLSELFPVAGVRLGVTSAGIKKPGRKDVVLIELAESATCAAVFTKNAFCAAPIQLAKQHIAAAATRYCLINTGNANAGTGDKGFADAKQTCAELAKLLSVDDATILPFSTGVIGEPLPTEKITSVYPSLINSLSDDLWAEAAEGIMTTDTRPKAASCQFELDGKTVTVTGIAKGAGMIKPNMATMLSYVATDANVEQDLLQGMLDNAVNVSFNRITVDSDTSTNDACVLIASGAVDHTKITDNSSENYLALQTALNNIFIELAHGLVKDAEGATKFVAVEIDQASSQQEALDVAYTIAESPLVKTALFASDPNWGRLLAAIGRAGVDDLDVSKIDLYLNDVLIARNGCRAESYTEEQGAAVMAEEEITIRVELNRGTVKETVWTSDLSHEYVRINAEYRT